MYKSCDYSKKVRYESNSPLYLTLPPDANYIVSVSQKLNGEKVYRLWMPLGKKIAGQATKKWTMTHMQDDSSLEPILDEISVIEYP